MIIPYATSMSTEIIAMVPEELKEAAYSLGVINDSMAVEPLIQALKDTIALSEQGGHWL